ncbi:MAG: hypothetical protein HQM09_04570 [Candidatus Riflebacteria bacterium]|nr:hypothetical protein [Candidatus Riflebacteria bacterium]
MSFLSHSPQKGNPRRISLLLVFGLLLVADPAVNLLQAASKSRDASTSGERTKRGGTSSRDTDSKKKSKDKDKSDASSGDKKKEDEELFLVESKENQAYLPDIYRCPECGYEQDETGTCPDHDDTELVLVRSKGKNPLEPPEVDGNEDLIVDMPVTGLAFKKNAPSATATAAAAIGSPAAPRPANPIGAPDIRR